LSRVLIIASPNPVSRQVGELLAAAGLPIEYAAGHIDAVHRLRCGVFRVLITSADGVIEEALALLEEMRRIRPNPKCIELAPYSTLDEMPFDAHEIFCVARNAATGDDSNEDIEVISARPRWIAVRVNCRLAMVSSP
jgi:DNA-binding NtrC family response regulator